MLNNLKLSFRNVNYKLYFALLSLGLAPTVYTTVRVFYLGSLPSEYSFSIAGQQYGRTAKQFANEKSE